MDGQSSPEVPSPSGYEPVNAITQRGFRIITRKLPILKAEPIERMTTTLGISPPEMIFGDNFASIEHLESGWGVEFNALQALEMVDKTGHSMLQVAHSKEWQSTREKKHEGITEVVKPFDWSYTTDYKGTERSASLRLRSSNTPIPLELLKRPDPIIFFDEVMLYEDEMADNGITSLSCKVRVMPARLLLLCRFFMRLDGVMVRIRDTRVYVEFDTREVIREYTAREDRYEAIRQKLAMKGRDVPAQLRDPNNLVDLLPIVDKTFESVCLRSTVNGINNSLHGLLSSIAESNTPCLFPQGTIPILSYCLLLNQLIEALPQQSSIYKTGLLSPRRPISVSASFSAIEAVPQISPTPAPSSKTQPPIPQPDDYKSLPPTNKLAAEIRKRAPFIAETYIAYGICEKLVKECASQADYTIPQRHEKNGVIPKTADGEDLGVGTGWWYESLGMTPTFNNWAQITFLHMYILTVRLRAFPVSAAPSWHQHLLDHFFYIAEDRMVREHNVYSRMIRNKYLKDLFTQWRGILAAYDEGLVKGDAVLATAVWRNIFYGREDVDMKGLGTVVSYMRGVLKGLEGMDDEEVGKGDVVFGDPGTQKKIVEVKSRMMDTLPKMERIQSPKK
ncbi:MAG: hypothetical protein Q9211_001644 [Gyalolechia sp. 1 TL-2023]